MRIDVFSLFPHLITQWADNGIVGRAVRSEVMQVNVHDLRMGSTDARRSVDDAPFGGGAGMVMCPGPAFATVEAVGPPRPLFLLGPGGVRFDQTMARQLAQLPGFSMLCGRYEGVDERIAEHLVDAELSLGDFVLAGGEAAAVAILESVGRLVPGVLGNDQSAEEESFSEGILEYPQYTRPARFREWDVPEVLLSGNHAHISAWRRSQALLRTAQRRPDLLEFAELAQTDVRFLAERGYCVKSLDANPRARSEVPSEEPEIDESYRPD